MLKREPRIRKGSIKFISKKHASCIKDGSLKISANFQEYLCSKRAITISDWSQLQRPQSNDPQTQSWGFKSIFWKSNGWCNLISRNIGQNLIKQYSHFGTKISKLDTKDRIFPPERDSERKTQFKFPIKKRFWTEIQRARLKDQSFTNRRPRHCRLDELRREVEIQSQLSSLLENSGKGLKGKLLVDGPILLIWKNETAWKRTHPFFPLSFVFFPTFLTPIFCTFNLFYATAAKVKGVYCQ